MFSYIASPFPNEGRNSHRLAPAQGNPARADAALPRRCGGASALAHSLGMTTLRSAAAGLIVAALTVPSAAQETGTLKVQHFDNPNPATSPIVALWNDQIAAHNAFMTQLGGPGAPKSGKNAPVYISSVTLKTARSAATVAMWLMPTTCEGVGNGPQLGDVEPQICQARIAITREGQTRTVSAEFCNLLYAYGDPSFNKKANKVTFRFDDASGLLTSSAFVHGKPVPECSKSLKL